LLTALALLSAERESRNLLQWALGLKDISSGVGYSC